MRCPLSRVTASYISCVPLVSLPAGTTNSGFATGAILQDKSSRKPIPIQSTPKAVRRFPSGPTIASILWLKLLLFNPAHAVIRDHFLFQDSVKP